MRDANQEILKKNHLVHELETKYPNLRLNTDSIISCQADDVQRLIHALLFDRTIERAVAKI